MMKRNTTNPLIAYIALAALVIISCTKDDPDDEVTPDPSLYSIGGTVEGLSGTGLVLKNNTNDSLSISANGIFTFTEELEDDSTYNVSIKTQPSGQICTVEDGSGTVDGADVSDVRVICNALPVSGGGSDDPPDNGSDGHITYYHEVANDYGGFHQGITVTGTVPFTYDSENDSLRGSGSVSIAVSGTITSTCTEISYSGTATMEVELYGTYNGNYNFDVSETWYVGSPTISGTKVDICDPDTEPYDVPLTEYTIEHQLTFDNVNGDEIVQPYSGAAGSGTYSWTLHIN